MNHAVDGSEDALTVTAKRKARVSTTLLKLEGPLRLRNVEYLVLERQMPEVLLSRPILVSLGFDLDAHLARVRLQCDEVDLSGVGYEPSTNPRSPQARSRDRLALVVSSLKDVHGDPKFSDDSDDESLSSPAEQLEQNMDSPRSSENYIWYNDSVDTGQHSSADVGPYVRQLLQQVIENAFPEQPYNRLSALLLEYEHILRLQLGSDPLLKIPSMNIRLQPGAEPVRVKLRRFAKPQADLLQRKKAELETFRLILRNPESASACASLIVPMDGPHQYRFTTDLRPVNKSPFLMLGPCRISIPC